MLVWHSALFLICVTFPPTVSPLGNGQMRDLVFIEPTYYIFFFCVWLERCADSVEPGMTLPGTVACWVQWKVLVSMSILGH